MSMELYVAIRNELRDKLGHGADYYNRYGKTRTLKYVWPTVRYPEITVAKVSAILVKAGLFRDGVEVVSSEYVGPLQRTRACG